MGRVVVIVDRCKGCGFCVSVCPAKVLKLSEDVNERGYRYVVVEDEARCLGCGLCELHCPDMAIYVEKA